jgi:NADP-reducing hydrogenase subunit HndD
VTKVWEGMEVKTHTMRVLNARRTVMELILSDHPFECLTCAKMETCDLLKMALDLGVREIHYQASNQLIRG